MLELNVGEVLAMRAAVKAFLAACDDHGVKFGAGMEPTDPGLARLQAAIDSVRGWAHAKDPGVFRPADEPRVRNSLRLMRYDLQRMKLEGLVGQAELAESEFEAYVAAGRDRAEG